MSDLTKQLAEARGEGPDPQFVARLREEMTAAAWQADGLKLPDLKLAENQAEPEVVDLESTVESDPTRWSRGRLVTGLAAAAVVALLGLWTLAVDDGEKIAVPTDAEVARALTAEALAEPSPERAMVLLAEAVELDPTPESLAALGKQIVASGIYIVASTEAEAGRTPLQISPDGRSVLLAPVDMAGQLWTPFEKPVMTTLPDGPFPSFSSEGTVLGAPLNVGFQPTDSDGDGYFDTAGDVTVDGERSVGGLANGDIAIFDRTEVNTYASAPPPITNNLRGRRFDAAGELVVIGQPVSIDGPARLFVWEVDSGNGFVADHPLAFELDDARLVAFSPDNSLVAAGIAGEVRLLDGASYETTATIPIGGEIRQVAFGSDGHLVVTYENEAGVGLLSVWDVTQDPVQVFGELELVLAGTVVTGQRSDFDRTPRSGRTPVVSADGTEVQIWQIDPATWPELVCDSVPEQLTPNELASYGIGVSVCDR